MFGNEQSPKELNKIMDAIIDKQDVLSDEIKRLRMSS